MAEYNGPHITGVYIRAELPDIGWCAVDVADPALPEETLREWLENRNDDQALKDLSEILLEKFSSAAKVNLCLALIHIIHRDHNSENV